MKYTRIYFASFFMNLFISDNAIETSKINNLHQFSNGEYFQFHHTHTLDEIDHYLEQLEGDYGKYLQHFSIGRTEGGRNIKTIKISSNMANFGYQKDVILIDAGIHSREWVAPSTAIIIIHKVLETIMQHPESSVSMVDWIIIPVLNPDGYSYTRSNRFNRLWRKNRSGCNGCLSNCSPDCCGADLNRNFDSGWKEYNISKDAKCYENYPGGREGSELETKALMNLVKNQRRLKAYISLHAAAQFIMYPFANSPGYSENHETLKFLSNRMSEQIQLTTGRYYKTGTFEQIMYHAPGTSMDWVYNQGIDLSFTIELPPVKKGQYNSFSRFYVKSEQIPEAGLDMWIAVQVLADYIVQQSSL